MEIRGWHGGAKKLKAPLRAGKASEGTGIYIAKDRGLAAHFGTPHRVKATLERPLLVDHEELPALEDFLMRGYFEYMASSVWIDANEAASRACGLIDLSFDEDPERYDHLVRECFPDALTQELMKLGYDGLEVRMMGARVPSSIVLPPDVRDGDLVWWVVFDPSRVKLI